VCFKITPCFRNRAGSYRFGGIPRLWSQSEAGDDHY
jgi:hypothetical protein